MRLKPGPPKGVSNNPNGRPKGAKNKGTSEFRAKLQAAFDGELDQIKETLEQLSPFERLDMLSKFLPYLIPRLAPVEIDPEGEERTPVLLMQYIEDDTTNKDN